MGSLKGAKKKAHSRFGHLSDEVIEQKTSLTFDPNIIGPTCEENLTSAIWTKQKLGPVLRIDSFLSSLKKAIYGCLGRSFTIKSHHRLIEYAGRSLVSLNEYVQRCVSYAAQLHTWWIGWRQNKHLCSDLCFAKECVGVVTRIVKEQSLQSFCNLFICGCYSDLGVRKFLHALLPRACHWILSWQYMLKYQNFWLFGIYIYKQEAQEAGIHNQLCCARKKILLHIV